jgi:hypothetical protein
MAKRTNIEGGRGNNTPTPLSAVVPLIPHLHGVKRFAEPCAGAGQLVRHLESFGLQCVYSGDIDKGRDAMTEPLERYPLDAIISNTPWERSILHPMIERFQAIAPTWLLFEADWAFTRQAVPFLKHCSHIVTIGRVKWYPGTKHTSFDNCAWYRFHAQHVDIGPRLIPASPEKARHTEPAGVAA